MPPSISRTALAGGCFFAVAPIALAQALMHEPGPRPDDGPITFQGQTYDSWAEVAFSGYFNHDHTRCGFVDERDELGMAGVGGGSFDSRNDCTLSSTTPRPRYEPSEGLYRVPVVVHIIRRSDGRGDMSDARVRSQIDILNEDFRAIPGSLGGDGADVGIEFYLATEDPDGMPTTGITRTTNNTWFRDQGDYWTPLHWDTNRYLNIYTNEASGALGYVPGLPQGGIVGRTNDRVVVLYSSFGRDAPLFPFDQGRTATHEVGHWLGLYHTFSGGCGSATSCNTTGDLICDTNGQNSPTFGCPSASSSCGLPAPFDNYMDYSDDRCMERFTPEQANRMRCTLENWRPDAYAPASAGCSPADLAEPFGTLDFVDFLEFQNLFAVGDPAADITGDGVLNIFDFLEFQNIFTAGC
ncbi:MAG: zinc metalloprotease [Planctomycetota bacterium]